MVVEVVPDLDLFRHARMVASGDHPHIGDISVKRIRFTTDAQPFSSFMAPRAMGHGGLLRKCRLERLAPPVSFLRNMSLRKQGAGIQKLYTVDSVSSTE